MFVCLFCFSAFSYFASIFLATAYYRKDARLCVSFCCWSRVHLLVRRRTSMRLFVLPIGILSTYTKPSRCWSGLHLLVRNTLAVLREWLSVLYEIIKLSVFIKQPTFSFSIQKKTRVAI